VPGSIPIASAFTIRFDLCGKPHNIDASNVVNPSQKKTFNSRKPAAHAPDSFLPAMNAAKNSGNTRSRTGKRRSERDFVGPVGTSR